MDAFQGLDYQPQLSTPALISQLRRLLVAERRAGGLACRYLADLADRIHERTDSELMAYVDEFHAAACFFNLGARETRERVRVGRALRSLPQIEAAFIRGDLAYSRVREITRVACGETESAWLDLARSLNMRSLERHVAGSVHKAADDAANNSVNNSVADNAANNSAANNSAANNSVAPERTGRTRRVTFELSPEAGALLERALEGARHRAATPLSDAEALEAVARDALSAQERAADTIPTTQPPSGETATHLGSSHDQPTTHLGSSHDQPTTHLGSSHDHATATRLLRIIGRRRHWTPDELGERSGLSFPELQHALLLLELDRRIRRDGCLVDPL